MYAAYAIVKDEWGGAHVNRVGMMTKNLNTATKTVKRYPGGWVEKYPGRSVEFVHCPDEMMGSVLPQSA